MENIEFHSVSLEGKAGERVRALLEENGLKLERGLDYTLIGEINGKLVATGSLAGPVLKCLATKSDYKGYGIMAGLVTRLLEEEYRRGNWHTFIYTRPKNINIFLNLGFREVAIVPDRVALLESGIENIDDFCVTLREKRQKDRGKISAVIVNCNPFTLGHQYLLERAAAENDWVHVFVVTEDLSLFPFEVRKMLVEQGTAHINNLTVHTGSYYVISSVTFPSYFTRDPREQVEDHAYLDVTIFGEYIAPSLNITDRYIGKEPYCPVTNIYNRVMQSQLPKYGIKVHEIPRITANNQPISASRVREALRLDDWRELEMLVPQTTLDFLLSDEAKPIIRQIKERSTPH
jgi:[citrate (pro-3S)-lyase] ligase